MNNLNLIKGKIEVRKQRFRLPDLISQYPPVKKSFYQPDPDRPPVKPEAIENSQYSKIIEMLFLGIPVPDVVVWDPLKFNKGEHYCLLKGFEVIEAIAHYLESTLRLTSLTIPSHLEGYTRDEIQTLSAENELMSTSIIMIEQVSSVEVINISTGWNVSDEDSEQWKNILMGLYRDV
ncbi:MAG: hypothetical protein F6J98_02450 [Moorea sp. SIO4G2]|nr:hypothetical protein [Moorena sp. SIO4G2]